MLFSNSIPIDRVQCAFISTEEVETLVRVEFMGYKSATTGHILPGSHIPTMAMPSGAAPRGNEHDHCSRSRTFHRIVKHGLASSLKVWHGIGYSRADGN